MKMAVAFNPRPFLFLCRYTFANQQLAAASAVKWRGRGVLGAAVLADNRGGHADSQLAKHPADRAATGLDHFLRFP